MSTYQSDGDLINDDNGITEDEAADAFLSSFTPDADDKPSGKGKDDTKGKAKAEPVDDDEQDDETDVDADASDEGPEDESDEDGSDDETDEEETERKYADEGVYTKVKVGDEEHEVSIKELTRLWGQEASLTKKSQEVAERRKTLDTQAAAHVASTNLLLQRAMQKAEPFAQLDFLALTKDPDISAAELTALREQAQAAFEEVQFLQNEQQGIMRAITQRQQTELVQQARDAIKVLSDPETGIKGWNDKLYDGIRSYAVTQGLDQEVVNNLTDPQAIKLLHKAMLYDRGKSKVVTTKVQKTPKKVVKTSHATQGKAARKGSNDANAMANLRRTGTTDAAADAFLAKWDTGSDD